MNLKIKRYKSTQKQGDFYNTFHNNRDRYKLKIGGLPATPFIRGPDLVVDHGNDNIKHEITCDDCMDYLVDYTLEYSSQAGETVVSDTSLLYPILDFRSDVFNFTQQHQGGETAYDGSTLLYAENIMSCSLNSMKNQTVQEHYTIEFTAFVPLTNGHTIDKGEWKYDAKGDPTLIMFDQKDKVGFGVETKFSLTACTPKDSTTHLPLNKAGEVYNIQTKTVPAAAAAPSDTKNRTIAIGTNINEVDTHEFTPAGNITGAVWSVESKLTRAQGLTTPGLKTS